MAETKKRTRKKLVEEPTPVAPLDAVKKLSNVDRLRFVECDTALLNHSQEIKILQQEQQLENMEFEKRRAIRQTRVNELKAAIDVRSSEQKLLLRELGEKYGFDPKYASIEDRTGVIAENKPED